MKKIVSLIAVSSILVNASATTTSAVYAEESKSNLNSKLSNKRDRIKYKIYRRENSKAKFRN